MCRCHIQQSCQGCGQAIDRRHFLKNCGAALVAGTGSLASITAYGSDRGQGGVRVAAVFLMSMDTHEIWPYPNFNTKGRQQEVLTR